MCPIRSVDDEPTDSSSIACRGKAAGGPHDQTVAATDTMPKTDIRFDSNEEVERARSLVAAQWGYQPQAGSGTSLGESASRVPGTRSHVKVKLCLSSRWTN